MSLVLDFALPAPPATWDNTQATAAHAGISASRLLQIEPVNQHFLAHARRKRHGRTLSEDDRVQAELKAEEQDEDNEAVEVEDEPETKALLELDPKDWKDQDHYAVLGLSKLRYKATPAQIKKAHRKKLLKHHPDKKAASGDINDDSFFKCIQKAYETLSDPTRRRQYDSVDPRVEDLVPKPARPDQFYEVYKPCFEREARFSRRLPVPELGGPETERETVTEFYDFWYNFDSWRSFEYLDKEEGDGPENRDDKRYVEKKNKAERAKRKKEDTARLRKIVDQALAADPRIKKFKDDEKAARDAKKKEREDAQRVAEEEAKKEEERLRAEKEREEIEARQRAENEKKDKEARKKAIRKERKTIKAIVKDKNYFCSPTTPTPAPIIDKQLSELDLLLEQLTLEETESLRRDLESDTSPASLEGKDRVTRDVELVVRRSALSAESFTEFRPSVEAEKRGAPVQVQAEREREKGREKERPWTTEELSLLIKAANKFPGGTVRRWEVIGDYVALHTGQPVRTQEELIRRSREVKKGAVALDVEEKERLQHLKKHADTRIEDAPTIRYDDAATVAGAGALSSKDAASAEAPKPAAVRKKGKKPAVVTTTSSGAPPAAQQPPTPISPAEEKKVKEDRPWTAEEQARLERALQAFPPSWSGEGERWEKIAEGVEGRSKRECKARVKYLAEQVKAKKAAAQGK